MPIYTAADDEYAAIHAAWVNAGRPAQMLHDGQAYVVDIQDDGAHFITVARDDPYWLDPSDPKKYWHGLYGYLRKGKGLDEL